MAEERMQYEEDSGTFLLLPPKGVKVMQRVTYCIYVYYILNMCTSDCLYLGLLRV